jgi:hypothetical protein
MALQFENLVINNRKIILELLGIKLEEVISENPGQTEVCYNTGSTSLYSSVRC